MRNKLVVLQGVAALMFGAIATACGGHAGTTANGPPTTAQTQATPASAAASASGSLGPPSPFAVSRQPEGRPRTALRPPQGAS